jgi:dolichol-phosphate mannosyltransferase
MDADFSHPPHDLLNLYDACKNNGADVSVGSRYIKGISVVNWPLGRILMSYYASMYVRTVLGMKVKDTTAGFVCYKREVLENIGIDQIGMKGYGFQIEMKYRSWKRGYKITEVPIIFTDRTEGSSKMSGGIFSEAFWGVLKLRLNAGKIKKGE